MTLRTYRVWRPARVGAIIAVAVRSPPVATEPDGPSPSIRQANDSVPGTFEVNSNAPGTPTP
ncbi:hypothetical protein DRA43_04615 [Micromonospora provocatoris]|nr:hypothetical protein DRA43_04615 [Micromonospora provocatoris]